MTFEEKMKKIEEYTTMLDSGKLSLDDSLKTYEDAIKLSKECLDSLDNAKGKILEIKKSIDGSVSEEEL